MSSHVSLLTFKFDNFHILPSGPGSFTWSSIEVDRDNNEWRAFVFPGGRKTMRPAEGDHQERTMVIGLQPQNFNDHQNYQLTVIIRNKNGSVFNEQNCSKMLNGNGFDGEDFIFRSDILNKDNCVLDKGSLHVDFFLQVKHEVDFENVGYFYLPQNPKMDVVDLLNKKFDASFAIGNEDFHLHRRILCLKAPTLADMCEGDNIGGSILLPDVAPEVFRTAIRYIYGGGAPTINTVLKLGKEIIHSADYFGIEDLKLVAETILVASRVIDISNVVDYLILADAKTCPLLKEYALAYIVARPKDVLSLESSSKLKESSHLLQQIILSMHQTYKPSGDNDVRSLAVDVLRRNLSEKCLDVYGSKEALVSRLEHSNKGKSNEE